MHNSRAVFLTLLVCPIKTSLPHVSMRLEESFSHDQILQLTLEVSCWNYQKLLVALAIAQPANPDFLTLVTLDEHGVIHHGELLDY